MNESCIEEAVVKTLAYFDIFDTPLTKEELYHFLWQPEEPVAETEFFSFLPHISFIEMKEGLHMLKERGNIVQCRQSGVRIMEKKMKIAKRAAKKLRWIPFVRAMFVCNTVAAASADDASDIDVFIIIRHGRLWLTRAFVTSVLQLFRLRRSGNVIRDRICLSFYVTDAHLDLSNIRINAPDVYLAYWIDQLIPVYDPDNMLEDIYKKNQWAREYLPHALLPYHTAERWRADDTRITRMAKKIREALFSGAFGDSLERFAKKLQMKKIEKNYSSVKDADDTRVVISDDMLKFHENDRREYYREEWRKRIKHANYEKYEITKYENFRIS